jgi:cytochrome c oxidase subunit 2
VELQLFPDTASTFASHLNVFLLCMIAVCGTIATGIAAFIIYSVLRYHRRDPNELPPQIAGSIKIETAWTLIPLLIFMGMFAWGAQAYFEVERPPADAMDIYVVAKQWMWKLQHPDGQREINTLHVPVGRAVRLTMTSQDVIHSFFVPAFRVKQDVLPERYTTIWFRASKPGKYHLFCAEYCGTKHSGMIGWIYALEAPDYQRWLIQGAAEGSLASTGEKLFHQFGCSNCHDLDGHGPCPNLRGLYGHRVLIEGGPPVIADDSYLRESILKPRAKIVAGFEAIMPAFAGQITEDQLIALISYIKSIGPQTGTQQPSSSGSAPKSYGTQEGIAGPRATSISQTEPTSR